MKANEFRINVQSINSILEQDFYLELFVFGYVGPWTLDSTHDKL